MNDIKLLDCTLRDGGYVNDWNFGYDSIISIYKRLSNAGIDIIELGFLDERRDFDINRTIMPNTQVLKGIYGKYPSNSLLVAMIDYGTCSLENIEDCKDSFIDGIRVIFKKSKIQQALDFCVKLKEKGYKVFVQPVSVTSYTYEEMIELVSRVNRIMPYAMSIVDTYGLLDKDKLLKYLMIIHENLDKNIGIGYHSHNNFQLAYANCIEYLKYISNRMCIVDASVYGMGKGAGNANVELVANYLNIHYDKCYNIDHILEIIDTDILRIFKNQPWGYSLKYYLAAMHDCHPNYVTNLLNKKTLSIEAVNMLLTQIPSESKLLYNEDLIEQSYSAYQQTISNDPSINSYFINCFSNRELLVLGPGESVIREKDRIDQFIKEKKPIIISANCLIPDYQIDYVFISNSKRYSQLIRILENTESQIIVTNNITVLDEKRTFNISYGDHIFMRKEKIIDNALIVFLNFLSKIGVTNVSLAGFDGFSNITKNYFNEFYEFYSTVNNNETANQDTIYALNILKEKISINFLTPSIYNGDEL